LAASLLSIPEALAATAYYVDPHTGNDADPGSEAQPWRTLREAIPRLHAGDTLYLRGGTYEETLQVSVHGEPSAPITIRNFPGETPVVDGSYPEFRTPGNEQWELVDAAKALYRSVATYPGVDLVHGYLEYQGKLYHLVPYERWNDLSTANQYYVSSSGIYVGQGVYWNSTDQKIYVRLQSGELQHFQGHLSPPTLDPRQVGLYLFSNDEVLLIEGGSSYLVFDGVQFKYKNNAIEFMSGSHDITVRNAELLGGRTHVMVRDGVHNLIFDGITVDDSVPPWITWEDVKSGTKPAHSLQGVAFNIQGSAHHVEIKNSTVSDVFDVLDATATAHDLHVHDNLFVGIRDDCFQLGSGGYNYHIHDNRMIHVSKGVSRHGSGSSPRPGTTWVHHNVVDNSRLMQYGRQTSDGTWHGKADPGMDGRVWATPFGSHEGSGFGQGDAWKIYHNTVIHGKDISNLGGGHTRSRRPGHVHEVYNNIFVQVTDFRIARGATAAGGMQIYDGNLYYRQAENPTNAIFVSYEPAGNGAPQSFQTLAEFVGSPFWEETRSFYAPGWETNSVEADPKLDENYKPGPGSPAAFGGVSLPEGLPGRDRTGYRGAVDPPPSPPILLQ
jgi:hypothetical protein